MLIFDPEASQLLGRQPDDILKLQQGDAKGLAALCEAVVGTRIQVVLGKSGTTWRSSSLEKENSS